MICDRRNRRRKNKEMEAVDGPLKTDPSVEKRGVVLLPTKHHKKK